ncbi:MAG: pyridoxal phosphate-dependent aminotransferase [Candidatus Gracilibacteria bacterium]|nr:pyridoxal phosphate-dependent aminotransferase [Candidatus Gracilibacteria bacterium]
MRRNLLHVGYKELSYEIREIVAIAKEVEKYGREIVWENVGDPVIKGEKIPSRMKEIVKNALDKNEVYAYSPTKGLDATREYLAKKNGKITKEDIIFFNGLGEAINKTYGYLAFSARVIGPNPAYPTHSSAEATNSGSEHITYTLDPNNDWNPDVEEIENKVKYNPNVAGILVINPHNPTGAVFKREVLEKIIDIARRYKLFVIFDEIYEKLVYEEKDRVLLRDIIGEVPGISMKGISKELPWPGGRCGRIEVYNSDKDENFAKYINSILSSKMLEVCSTTLPQYVIPEIYEKEEFKEYLKNRIEKYKQKAEIANKYLGDLDNVLFVKPKGAFYLAIKFDLSRFNLEYTPEIKEENLKKFLEEKTKNKRFDKKFCYYMIAKNGICTVPLSGFNSTFDGFRMTILEEDLEKFEYILKNIREFIIEYRK